MDRCGVYAGALTLALVAGLVGGVYVGVYVGAALLGTLDLTGVALCAVLPVDAPRLGVVTAGVVATLGV